MLTEAWNDTPRPTSIQPGVLETWMESTRTTRASGALGLCGSQSLWRYLSRHTPSKRDRIKRK